jgi:nitrite reductase (NADH) large subunit
MAALRLVEELVALCPDRYRITMVGAEARPAYNRMLLSSLLAGDATEADIELRPPAWYAHHRIELLTGVACTALDSSERVVALSNGASLAYDRLVLATGSRPLRLPVSGGDLAGVLTFRDLDDVGALRHAGPDTSAVVIGGGLLGVEAAYGLAKRGCKVTLLHIMPQLMERQLDARAAALLHAAIRAKGIEVVLGADTAAIEGSGCAEHVVLRDGRRFPASLVVMAAGVRPATALAQSGGLAIGRGICVDDRLETSSAGVYALGECAEHAGVCCGLVEPAYAQAKVLARLLAGLAASYAALITPASLKVSGIPLVSIGDFAGEGAEAILLEDQGTATYRKLVVRDGRLVGALLLGDTADALWYRDLIRRQNPIAAIRGSLAFGKAYAEAA